MRPTVARPMRPTNWQSYEVYGKLQSSQSNKAMRPMASHETHSEQRRPQLASTPKKTARLISSYDFEEVIKLQKLQPAIRPKVTYEVHGGHQAGSELRDPWRDKPTNLQ